MRSYKRKLQIIAGSTYSLSLPKDWVTGMQMQRGQELVLSELQDGNLLVSPGEMEVSEDKISVVIEHHIGSIGRILTSLYHYGYNLIDFVSNKEITNEARVEVRKQLANLSGAEIIDEEKRKISIRVMFDEDKVNIYQLLYRMDLIIEASIENLISHFDFEEIKVNEDEVDRLYHLSSKIITSSLKDRKILLSSEIKYLKIVPSLFLIAKKLENMSDNLKKLGNLVENEGVKLDKALVVLKIINEEVNKSILYLMGKQKKNFEKISFEDKEKIKTEITNIKTGSVKIYIERLFGFMRSVQGEVAMIAFYNKLNSN
ncbi:MAG: hypothetical protein PF542_02720 [Nanoarchaeota archaeon]|jgi:phosphate uptake regulator|nr:hypothetical protein [Nanoarchaeota archaeon]